MTRKEELEWRARDYVSLFVMSGAEPAATKNLSWMLQQVEREVWERAAKHIRHYNFEHNHGKKATDACDDLADWCEAQQKELG